MADGDGIFHSGLRAANRANGAARARIAVTPGIGPMSMIGSYDLVWWLSAFFGIASAIINLPIVEKPVVRPAAAAA